MADPSRFDHFVGKTFSRLTIKGITFKQYKTGPKAQCKVECSSGVKKIMDLSPITSGQRMSCGCLR